MMISRKGESLQDTKGRTSRFYKLDDYWYYTTREGIHIGPFDNQLEAQNGANDFIDFVLHATDHDMNAFRQYSASA